MIEEDADSFAQRAEMYYQKRPELVNLVEEFYRAYRSLAERYDHLTGEIRQNIPRALQVQYGLSCDSPKSMGPTGAGHYYSPLRKNHQAFESLLKKVCQPEDKIEHSEQVDQMRTPSPLHDKQGRVANAHVAFSVQNGHGDPSLELRNKEKVLSPERGLMSSSSDCDVDNANPLERLQQEIYLLEKENKMLADSHNKVVQMNIALQKTVEALEDQCKSAQNEAHVLESKLDELNSSLSVLQGEKMQANSLLWINITDKENIEQEKLVDKDIVACGCEDRLAEDADAVDAHRDSDKVANYPNVFECEHQDSANTFSSTQEPRLDSLQDQVILLMQENRRQKLAILERGEEKREAIRQLCFSIDLLKLENRRLEVMLGSMKKRFDASINSQQLFSAWKRVLCLGD